MVVYSSDDGHRSVQNIQFRIYMSYVGKRAYCILYDYSLKCCYTGSA